MLIRLAKTWTFVTLAALSGAGAALAAQTPSAEAPASAVGPAPPTAGQNRFAMASATTIDPTAPAGSAANPLPMNSPVASDLAYTLKAGDPTVVTNGPIPDTQANRARYGQPMSHAGRATQPAGN